MVSPAMMGTINFLRAYCDQHGGGASGGFLSASLLSYRALRRTGADAVRGRPPSISYSDVIW